MAKGATLHEAKAAFEEHLIADALHETDGNYTRAAELLGMKSQQALLYIVNAHYPHLRPAPPRHRSANKKR